MSTLKQKAQDILDEKEEKIIPENIKKDIQIFDVTGTLEEGIDTSDATATENDLVENASAYVNGVKIDGTLIDSREESTIRYIGSAHYVTNYGTDSTVSFKLPQNTPDMVVDSENEFLGYIDNANLAYSIGLTADILKKNENVLGVIGTLEGGTDTSDANATENDLVENTTAYVKGVKLAGAIGDSRDDPLDIIPEAAAVVSHTTLSVVGHLDLPCASSSVAINNGTSIHIEEIDLTDSEITDEIGLVPEVIKRGETILGITGTLDTSGTDTSDATATANDLVMNTTAYVKGTKISGSIRDYRSESGISDFDDAEYSGEIPAAAKLKLLTHMASNAADTVISSDNNIELLVPYSELTTNLGLTADKIKKGETILGVTGTLDSEGTDTSDATATENDLVADTTAYVNGVKITGKLFDNRNSSGYNEIDGTEIGDFTDAGYLYSGGYIKKLPNYLSGVVFSDEVLIKVKTPYSTITGEIGLTSDKLKKGVTILGVTGTLDAQGTDTSDATATANDIVENTTAYVKGAKLTGNIVDRRSPSLAVSLETTSIGDNSNTELIVDLAYVPDNPQKPNLVMNDTTPLFASVQYSDIVNELNITSDMIRKGKEILGVTGTYSGDSIVYLEPGDEIHINFIALQTALLNATDAETRARELAYDEENEDLFTLKMMDCINLGQPYEHSGMGLVMNGTTTFLKIFSWDSATDTNTVQLSDFIELVSIDYPTPANFDINALIGTMSCLGGYHPTDLTFTYPSNAPIIPLINDNTVKLLTRDGCDIGEVLTFNISSSFIRIVKGCA